MLRCRKQREGHEYEHEAEKLNDERVICMKIQVRSIGQGFMESSLQDKMNDPNTKIKMKLGGIRHNDDDG